MCQPQTSLRSDIAGERMPRTLLPVADSADFFKAERLAFALGEPSRKNADGEKLPGVSPVTRHNTNGRVSVCVTKKRREGVCVQRCLIFEVSYLWKRNRCYPVKSASLRTECRVTGRETHTYIPSSAHIDTSRKVCAWIASLDMGWLQLVGSIKL